jgi:hypothetical protein
MNSIVLLTMINSTWDIELILIAPFSLGICEHNLIIQAALESVTWSLEPALDDVNAFGHLHRPANPFSITGTERKITSPCWRIPVFFRKLPLLGFRSLYCDILATAPPPRISSALEHRLLQHFFAGQYFLCRLAYFCQPLPRVIGATVPEYYGLI